MNSQKPKFKRSQYYVLPKFQNHFMAVALFQVLLFVGGMIIPQYRILSAHIAKKEAQVVSAMSDTAASAMPGANEMTDAEELQNLVLMRNSIALYSVVFVSATCLIFGFYFSHRLGGPIFKTIQYLRKYRNGEAVGRLTFRKGDFFHELAEEMNQVLQKNEK